MPSGNHVPGSEIERGPERCNSFSLFCQVQDLLREGGWRGALSQK